MAAIVTRAGKGSPLTNAEVDANFVNLNAAVVAAPGDVVGPAGATASAIARWDTATGKLLKNSVVTVADAGQMVINVTGGAAPAPVSAASLLQLSGPAGLARVEANVFGGPFTFLTRYARGTPAVPSAAKQWEIMAAYSVRGYGATGWATSNAASMQFFASEDWTDTAQGAGLLFETTPTGDKVAVSRWQIMAEGHLIPSFINTVDIGTSAGGPRSGYFHGRLQVDQSNTGPAPIDAGTLFLGNAASLAVARLELNACGNVSQVVGRVYNGTPAAPAGIGVNHTMLNVEGRGCYAPGLFSTARATISFFATETWGVAAQGAAMAFATTPNGGTTLAVRWQIQPGGDLLPLGGVNLGSPTLRAGTVYGVNGDFSGSVGGANVNASTALSAPTMNMIRFGVQPVIASFHAGGTQAAPTPTMQFDTMFSLFSYGRAPSGTGAGQAQISAQASENWTDNAQGTNIYFSTTPIGTKTVQAQLQIMDAGHLRPLRDNQIDLGTPTERYRTLYAGIVSLTGGIFTNAVSGLGPGIQIGAYATAPFIEGVRANGTSAAPTAVKAFDTLMWLTGKGRKDTAFSVTSASVQFEVPQDWTDASTPAHINFQTTPIGANAPVYRWHMSNAGHFWPFVNNAVDIGAAANRVRTVYGVTGDFSGAVQGTEIKSTIGAGMALSGENLVNSVLYFAASPPLGAFVYQIPSKSLDLILNGLHIATFDPAGQSLKVDGEITFGAGADKVEPRGRYYARPAPGGSYTLALADAGAFVVVNAAAPAVITIPPQSAVAWKSWTRIDVLWYGAGQVSFAPGAGVTLTSSGGKRKLAGQYSSASLVQVNPDEWLLIGDIIA